MNSGILFLDLTKKTSKKKCGLTEKQYKEFREKLIEERGNKCEKCGVSRKEKRFHVHHIKHYQINFNFIN